MEPFNKVQAPNGTVSFVLSGWGARYPGLTAGISSRVGGTSSEPFHTLNCGLHVNDAAADVVENRRRLADAVGIPLECWTYGEQVHGHDVQKVSAADKGKGTQAQETAFPCKDAFITKELDLCLAGLFADCVPLFFVDPVHRAVGLAHAGWKGTVARIAEQTVQAMMREYRSQPEQLLTAIGPSIRSCCYEVDGRVIERVHEALQSGSAAVKSDIAKCYKRIGDDVYRLNLQEVNRQIMIIAGILPSHIEITHLCTGCNTDLLYSHRKEKGRTGRMAAWIGWKGAEYGDKR